MQRDVRQASCLDGLVVRMSQFRIRFPATSRLSHMRMAFVTIAALQYTTFRFSRCIVNPQAASRDAMDRDPRVLVFAIAQ
ncbi:hypothetical protein LJR296_003345 [Cupriavidus necator]|uniref:hypothetical protein n=1 Tax=Cupriavidus necator TaxID=106590 RepID=UPI003ECD7ED4